MQLLALGLRLDRMGAEQLVILGAGAAGLSAAWHARVYGLEALLIDRQGGPGGAWRRMRPNMKCLSHRKYDRLPDGTFPRGPGNLARAIEVKEWLQRFAAQNAFESSYSTSVTRVWRRGGVLRVQTSSGTVDTRRLLIATGEHGAPWVPSFASTVLVPQTHSSRLKEGEVASNERVLVVGGGNSGAEVTRLLLEAGATVFLSLGRRAVRHVPMPKGLLADIGFRASGLPVHFFPNRLGCTDRTPLVDSMFHDAIREGRVEVVPRVVGATTKGVRLEDGHRLEVDRVVWATGFKRETDCLSAVLPVGSRGEISQRKGRVASDIGVVGIPCMRTRRSGFLRGFADDSRAVLRALL